MRSHLTRPEWLGRASWELCEGLYLNAEVGGRELIVTLGQVKCGLDFNSL